MTKNLAVELMSMLKDYESETIDLLMQMTPKMAAQRLEMKVETLYQRLYRLRKKIEKAQNFINQINSYKKRNPRIRKLLTVVPKEVFATLEEMDEVATT